MYKGEFVKITLTHNKNQLLSAPLTVIAVTQKNKKIQFKGLSSDVTKQLQDYQHVQNFKGSLGDELLVSVSPKQSYYLLGLGDEKKLTSEKLRRFFAKSIQQVEKINEKKLLVNLDTIPNVTSSISKTEILSEAALMTDYKFDRHKNKKIKKSITELIFFTAKSSKKEQEVIIQANRTCESINFARDLINEAPNILHSERYAKIIEKDVKDNLKRVKTKILNKADLKKEKMNLFLSVNNGSAYEPRLVHLTYTPSKSNQKTKHYALVGKGITFDTGGYSLKPSGSMMGMKFDMGGSATVYAAFRAAVLNQSPHKLTCLLAITDNAVNSKATTPDSIVVARNGMSVEILNTDAEGRLILADTLDYACDLKPDAILDAATLTGACLVALGSEVGALLSNNHKLSLQLLKCAKERDEYLWELPIIEEFRIDMKSKVADLKNIGTPMRAGTATAAAFLEYFIKDDIPWAHFDIAGVGDSQKHLPYCPSQGASGLMVRTLYQYLMN